MLAAEFLLSEADLVLGQITLSVLMVKYKTS